LPLHRLLRDRARDREGQAGVRPFDYVEPATLDEALALLTEDGESVVMAGGTALVILMKQDLLRPTRVVGLRRLSQLRAVHADGTLQLGALATHGALARSAAVRAHCAALAATFGSVATPRIRAQATLGGNLVHADPAQDPPVTLLALDAEAVVMSAKRARRVPLAELFVDVFETSLEPDELLLRVEVPPLPPGARATYRKFLPNTQDDYATVSVAACLATDESGACTHARIALGSAGPVPIRAREAERALLGRRLDGALIREAAALAAQATDPLDDLRGTATYKRAMAAVWTERALRDVA
jgi:aerobic carbon-monoxide dehydrogenase medium subunit